MWGGLGWDGVGWAWVRVGWGKMGWGKVGWGKVRWDWVRVAWVWVRVGSKGTELGRVSLERQPVCARRPHRVKDHQHPSHAIRDRVGLVPHPRVEEACLSRRHWVVEPFALSVPVPYGEPATLPALARGQPEHEGAVDARAVNVTRQVRLVTKKRKKGF